MSKAIVHITSTALGRACLLACGLLVASGSVLAQKAPDAPPAAQPQLGTESAALTIPQRIVALVNDDPISAYDVVQRLRLTVASIGGLQDESQFARLQEQVVRNMVDDRLKLQEAAQFDVVISDEEAEDAFRQQAASMGQTPEQFEDTLARMGVTKEAYFAQIKPEIAWGEIVNGVLGRMATVAQDEVEQELERMQANAGQPEFHLAEIYLLVDGPAREEQMRNTASRIVAQIRAGASFEGFAQQFSQSSTAANGGDMGWLTLDQLAPPLAEAVESLSVEDISEPIRFGGGYYILQLRDRRRVLEADPLDAELDIRQIFVPMDIATASEEEQLAFVSRFDTLRPGMKSCDEIPSYAADLGTKDYGPLGTLSLRDLPSDLRRLIENLEIGQPARPARMPDGFRVFFVCDRQAPEVQTPSFDEILDRLERQKLAMMARRYLRDLRRDAVVDYR